MKHLLKNWGSNKKILQKKYIMLFLDYDGTLTPIVDTPDKAVLSGKMRRLLSRVGVAPGCRMAVISGRSLKNIKNMVGLKGIIYSGNHGLEIEGPKIVFKSPIAAGFKPTLKKIKSGLTKRLSKIMGVLIEDKGLTLTVHYRLVKEQDIPAVKRIVRDVLSGYTAKNKVKVKKGKKVFEIRPPIQWDKGKIVLWLLARQMSNVKKESVLPIYIGDDVTDEDAFKALRRKGLTVFVGEPKTSFAKYFLKDTEEVGDFLIRLLDLKKGSAICQN